MTSEDYKIWEQNVVNAIKDVSDIEMQRTAWLGEDPNLVSSFWEVIMVLYDDFGFEDYIKYYESSYRYDEFLRQMKRLDGMISTYTPSGVSSDAPILIDPRWRDITEQAKRTYDSRPKQNT
jgi:hypothetical protein